MYFTICPTKKKTTTGIEFIILKNNQNTTGKNLVINLEVTFERRSVLLAFYVSHTHIIKIATLSSLLKPVPEKPIPLVHVQVRLKLLALFYRSKNIFFHIY